MHTHERHADSRASGRARNAGFTLLEVLTAAVIVGLALGAVGWSMTAAAQARSTLADEPLSYLLARELRELAETLPREPSGAGPATQPAEVLALDTLDGAVFTPPLRADGSADAALAGWSQSASLALCSLDDPGVATGEDPRAGADPHAERVYRLRVEVRHDGELVDSFDWWITP
jgi:prepilin-type N-terminal cleavage/methylation domain-containing protein